MNQDQFNQYLSALNRGKFESLTSELSLDELRRMAERCASWLPHAKVEAQTLVNAFNREIDQRQTRDYEAARIADSNKRHQELVRLESEKMARFEQLSGDVTALKDRVATIDSRQAARPPEHRTWGFRFGLAGLVVAILSLVVSILAIRQGK